MQNKIQYKYLNSIPSFRNNNEVLVHAHYDNSFTHLSRNKDYGYCKLYLKKKHNLK